MVFKDNLRIIPRSKSEQLKDIETQKNLDILEKESVFGDDKAIAHSGDNISLWFFGSGVEEGGAGGAGSLAMT